MNAVLAKAVDVLAMAGVLSTAGPAGAGGSTPPVSHQHAGANRARIGYSRAGR